MGGMECWRTSVILTPVKTMLWLVQINTHKEIYTYRDRYCFLRQGEYSELALTVALDAVGHLISMKFPSSE